MGTTERLQRNAEQKQREAGQREELMTLIASLGGVEATTEVFDKFLTDLTVETGALPPLDRVVEAVQLANSIEAAKVGNAVRQLFRRPRPRPAGSPPAAPPAAPTAPIRPTGPDAPAEAVAPPAQAESEAPAASAEADAAAEPEPQPATPS
jgi:hypothetical protein